MNVFKLTTILFTVIFYSNYLFAAGSDNQSKMYKTKSTAYLNAEKLINNKQYTKAIEKLNDALFYDKKDPDIYNYLGFSHRKLGQLKQAATYYNKALSIDPKHKGTLEYQGQLFITLNQIDKAKENLNKLDKICFLGCKEFDKLKKSLDNLKKGKKSSY